MYEEKNEANERTTGNYMKTKTRKHGPHSKAMLKDNGEIFRENLSALESNEISVIDSNQVPIATDRRE